MIICAHCHHQNSDEFSYCEACCSALTAEASCPNCGHNHLATARFCGHCGYLLEDQPSLNDQDSVTEIRTLDIPEPLPPDPVIDLSTLRPINPVISLQSSAIAHRPREQGPWQAPHIQQSPQAVVSRPRSRQAILIHQSTQTQIPLDRNQFPIHLGKPNRKIMPDIDLSTFQHSAIVSRIHADIQIENDTFLIRDSGSANGTFVNNQRIHAGQVQPLESGDKISLGQGDLVTFIFELS